MPDDYTRQQQVFHIIRNNAIENIVLRPSQVSSKFYKLHGIHVTYDQPNLLYVAFHVNTMIIILQLCNMTAA